MTKASCVCQWYKNYKDKGKQSWYIVEEERKNGFDDHDVEVVYVAMEEDYDEDEETTLVSYVNKSDTWIIDIRCSHHMARDKSKFITLNYYDGNSVRFGNDASCLIKGKGSIKLIENILFDNTYYVEGLNYNLLSVSQLNSLGCKVEFENILLRSMILMEN